MGEKVYCTSPGGNWKCFDFTEDRSAILEEKLKQNPENPEIFSEWMAYLLHPVIMQTTSKDERLTRLEKLDKKLSELSEDSLLHGVMKHKRDKVIQFLKDMQLI